MIAGRPTVGAVALAAALLAAGCTGDDADPGPTGDAGTSPSVAGSDVTTPPSPPDASAAVTLDVPDGFTPQEARDRGSLRWDGPEQQDGGFATVVADVDCLEGDDIGTYVEALRSQDVRGPDYMSEGEVQAVEVPGAAAARVWSGRLNVTSGGGLSLVFTREGFALAEDGTAVHVRFQGRDRYFDPGVANAVVDSLQVSPACG